MPQKRLYLFLFALAIGCGVAILLFGVFHAREPQYEGRKLSQWVMDVYDDHRGIDIQTRWRGERTVAEAERAIGQMGPKAVPYLLKWMEYERPAWKESLYRLLNPTLPRLKSHLELKEKRAYERAIGSVFALVTNLPMNNDKAGIAQFSELTSSRHSQSCRLRAIAVLGCFAEKPPPALLRLVEDPEQKIRSAATNALGRIDPKTLGRGTPAENRRFSTTDHRPRSTDHPPLTTDY